MTLTVAGAPIGTVRVMVATKPVDFRKGAEGLAALVRETLGADPFSGAIYVFRAKRADRVKLVWWDGTGVCLYAKRLEDGRFCWPSVAHPTQRTSASRPQASRRANWATSPSMNSQEPASTISGRLVT